MTPTLVVMAAGLSARYAPDGSRRDKQVDGIGPAGEWLLEYSLFDARRAGYRQVVCVIRPELDAAFDALTSRVPRDLHVTLVHQEPGNTPRRSKPWGTVHAVSAARAAISGPFTVINADDFYGAGTYRLAAGACAEASAHDVGAVVAFPLTSTLSDHGPVTRAMLDVDGEWLTRIREAHGVTRDHAAAGALVSMNCWTFPMASVARLAERFDAFARDHAESADAELPIPDAVNALIAAGQLRVHVQRATDGWFGLTHAADREDVRRRLLALVDAGVYPSPLWT